MGVPRARLVLAVVDLGRLAECDDVMQAVKPGTEASRRSWHWLQAEDDAPEIMFWGMRERWAAVGDPVQYTPAELAAAGYRYLCPVCTLSETNAAS